MPELVQETKKMTLAVKSNISKQDTQNTNLLKILEVDSTSNEKDLTPYWTESCLETSRKWLSHIETDCAGLDSNLLNELQVNTTAKSWFSAKHHSPLKKNLLKTCFPSFTFSPVDFTVSENTVIKSKKIRIYPKNPQQVRKWFGLSRYWYNKTVEYLKQEGTKASLYDVRKILQDTSKHEAWAFDCPQRIREHAMSDACDAVKNAKAKFLKTKEFQDVSFKRKKGKQSFRFDKQSLKDDFIFSQKNMRTYFYATEGFKTELEGTEVCYENGRYFLIVPIRTQIKKPDNQRLEFVSLDPGVRTFISYFSPEVSGKLGEGDFNRIYRLCRHVDRLISKRTKAKCKAKRNIRKAIDRIKWKIQDLVSELHHKIAYFLVTRFETIYLPTFETSQMATKLTSKTARNMLTFRHYEFKQFLKFKAKEYSATVIDCCEAYTSKTCSFCGKIHNMGSKKILKCSCGITVDRDLNGARGILLRALAVTPRQKKSAIVNFS